MRHRLPLTTVITAISVLATAAAAAPSAPTPRVLVFPLQPIHVPEDSAWIEQSVNENVVASLNRSAAYSAFPYSGKLVVATNNEAAVNARQGNFPLAVRGSVQVVDTQVRLTAQLIDTRNGIAVRTGIATGALSDLLKVEDDLAAQLLGQPSAAAAPANVAAAPAAAAAQPPVHIVIDNSSNPYAVQPQPYMPPAYSSYPYAGYPASYYPGIGLYPGIILTTVNTGRDHHRDHDHGHGGGDNNGGGGRIIFTPGTPDNGPNVPGQAMAPGVIGEPSPPRPVYTRPPLPGTQNPPQMVPFNSNPGGSDARH